MMQKRKKYFVKKTLQVRYLLFVLLAMTIPTIVCCGALYYFIWQSVAAEIAIPEAIAEQLIPALTKVNLVLLVAIPLVFFIMLFFSIIISHRIAGPLYRLEKELKAIALSGDYTKRITFRRRDEIREIADSVNELLASIEKNK